MNEAYKIIENIKLSDINAFPVSSRTFCDFPRFPGEKKKGFQWFTWICWNAPFMLLDISDE